MRQLPSLNGLRVFEAVTRHLNFRRAAEELGVTQGAVAQQIRGLEAELGLKLFERQPRTLVLTEAGRNYIPSVRRAFELIKEATQALRPGRRHVTVSVTPTFAAKWLIPRLPEFTRAHPDVDLRIVATDRLSDFQAEGVDLAIRYGRPPFGADLNATLLFQNIVVAVASPRLLEELGRPERNENLSRYPLLHDGHSFWPLFLEQMRSPSLPPAEKNIRFNQTSLAIDAAIAGQGLALAGLLYVEADLAAGRLVRVLRRELRVESAFYLVVPKSAQQSPSVMAVGDWLVRESDSP